VWDAEFEWDPAKNLANFAKHGVWFEDAVGVFGDPLAATILDEGHSYDEERWVTIGLSKDHRLVVVWHTDDGRSVRLIGARPVTAAERRAYECGQ
jgi:uncharacterized protein